MSEFVGIVFAIVQAVNVTSGLRMVQIMGVPDEAACRSSLEGAPEGDREGRTLIERADCVRELPPDYIEAMLNRPIPDTMIVAYEIQRDDRSWPVRIIHTGVAEAWQSEAGCDRFAEQYRHITGEARCINGY